MFLYVVSRYNLHRYPAGQHSNGYKLHDGLTQPLKWQKYL